jgi:hypothetical protein
VHIALHGCKQNADTIGDRYIRHAGYNEWADTNHLIILYPQTITGNPAEFEPLNPFGCWDWWGYTNFNYAVKAGRQISTIKAMLDRLTSRYLPNQVEQAMAAGIVINDISDTGAALAWSPLAGARGYAVSRASTGDSSFKELGSVVNPSFGDMGLHPATSYNYKVSAIPNGNAMIPSSLSVTAITLPVPRDVTAGGLARSADRFPLIGCSTVAGKPFEQGCGGAGFGGALGRGGRSRGLVAGNARSDGKERCVIGAGGRHKFIARQTQSARLRPFL